MHAILEHAMAKTRKPQDAEPARKDMAVRIDSDALDTARIVAAYRKVPVSEYISQVVRDAATRDHAAEIAKRK